MQKYGRLRDASFRILFSWLLLAEVAAGAGQWRPTAGAMNAVREQVTLNVLPDAQALAAGGLTPNGPTEAVELYAATCCRMATSWWQAV